jgi:DDE superfamily endonuclease
MSVAAALLSAEQQGGRSCHVLLGHGSSLPRNFASNSRPWSALALRPKPWSFAVGSSSAPPTPTSPATSKSLRNWTATAIPSANGANASWWLALPACRTPHAPDDPGAFPPDELVAVVNLATSKTEEHDQPATRWSLNDLAATIVNETHHQAMSRSTIWRILDEADLKPHKSIYWLNSHDPDFDAKAKAICRLYLDAPRLYQQGRLVICCDEKTGMQILQRKFPTQPAEPGKPEKREFEYIRHGTRALITSFAVPTGEVVWDLGPTRTSADFGRHIGHVATHFRQFDRFDWVVDNLNTHWSMEVCEYIAALSNVPFEPRQLQTGRQRKAFLTDATHKHVFHFTPKHGSWLNQVELWFSVLSRRFLKRGDFASPTEFEQRLSAFLEAYNTRYAHPYRWTYTGQPLVRGTPFAQTRRQQQRGRAGVGTKTPCWERFMYPPRPYKRSKSRVAANF